MVVVARVHFQLVMGLLQRLVLFSQFLNNSIQLFKLCWDLGQSILLFKKLLRFVFKKLLLWTFVLGLSGTWSGSQSLDLSWEQNHFLFKLLASLLVSGFLFQSSFKFFVFVAQNLQLIVEFTDSVGWQSQVVLSLSHLFTQRCIFGHQFLDS